MTDNETKRRLDGDPDFVDLPKFGFSLARALKRYPDGLPEEMIGEALGQTAQQVRGEYDRVVAKLREAVEAKRARR